MLPASVLVLLLLSPQQSAPCPDLEVCRAEALIAHARKDYEAFHDLAWAAYRKGRSSDPELMLLVARAQSLSGRPGDALVMLERIAALGAKTDALVSEDFVRVRALPRWPEVAAKLEGHLAASPPTPAAARTGKRESEPPAAPKPTQEPDPTKPTTKGAAPKAEPPSVEPLAISSRPVEPTPKAEVATLEPLVPKRAAGAPVKFSTTLTPSALAYDMVSKRFIIADRRARRIAVVDENSGQVATLVGALGDLGDIDGVAIDAQKGDLWIASSSDGRATLHRAQLVSGRILSTRDIEGIEAPVVSLTFVPGHGLVAADGAGHLWLVRGSGRAEKLGTLEYVPRALAADDAGRLYVSAGGPRLARFSVGPSLRKTDLVELHADFPTEGPFAIATGRLLTVVPGGDGYEIRTTQMRTTKPR